MPILTIRLSEEEQLKMLEAHAVSEDRTISGHVKRVYFEALQGDHETRASIAAKLESIESLLKERKTGQGAIDSDLLTLLVSSIYLRMREQATLTQRMEMDKYVKVQAIENFVKGQ